MKAFFKLADAKKQFASRELDISVIADDTKPVLSCRHFPV